ncbi:hypothetical protein [Actinomyces sp. ZJ308]|uniref:hypothetical protein n=1 Tax=Actinomyces sp. ZJ308 TaxID=2708342 RepID=UPI001FBA8FAF|nr:hypothetical protein [Actinomyces sp. ZJ308]
MTWASSSCQSVLLAFSLPLAEADSPAEDLDDEADPPLFLDTPGRSHPASTGNPSPAKADRTMKERRDGVVKETPRESKNAEATETPSGNAGTIQRLSVIKM